MKSSTRILLIYTVSLLGAGGVAYWRGRRGKDFAVDMLLHGLVVGTGLNVVGWLLLESGETVPLLGTGATLGAVGSTLLNPAVEAGVGKLTSEGLKLLNQIDASTLFAPLKANGVKIGPVPENPSIIAPDLD